MIQAALEILPAVIGDLQSGINSRHGYEAWFKSNASSAYVQTMLQNIYTAQTKVGLLPQPGIPSAPRFACITPGTSGLYPWMRLDPFSVCVATHSHGVRAFYYGGSSYILICPSFWSLEPWPLKSGCPTVIHNRFVGAQVRLSNYKTYVLIHEMVHFYLGRNSLSQTTAPPEQYALNNCVGLGKVDSLRNPANYQHYLASKS